MAFLVDNDYKMHIKDEILSTVLGAAASTIRPDAERKAQAQLTSVLNVRYDVPGIFAQSGEARNAEVVMYMVDMVIYHVHSRISPGQVPENVKARYQDALDWIKMVAAGKLDPDLPKPAGSNEGVKNDVKWGGRDPRDPYY